jgi:hypothetical protein
VINERIRRMSRNGGNFFDSMQQRRFKKCVVIQGGYDSIDTIDELRHSFIGYQIIFSTWEDVPPSWFRDDDIVLYNERPSIAGPSNFNLQKVSTINGVQLALELGWNRVIKWRSDMIPKNVDKLVHIMNGELNMYLWVNSHCGYVTDYVMEGECWDIIKLFSTQVVANKKFTFPEHFVTLQMYKNELNFKVKMFGMQLGENVDIFWKKRGYYLSENKTDKTLYSDSVPLLWEAYPIL